MKHPLDASISNREVFMMSFSRYTPPGPPSTLLLRKFMSLPCMLQRCHILEHVCHEMQHQTWADQEKVQFDLDMLPDLVNVMAEMVAETEQASEGYMRE